MDENRKSKLQSLIRKPSYFTRDIVSPYSAMLQVLSEEQRNPNGFQSLAIVVH